MPTTSRLPIRFFLFGLLAFLPACGQLAPTSVLTPEPSDSSLPGPVARAAILDPTPASPTSSTRNTIVPVLDAERKTESTIFERVAWTAAAPLRAAPAGVGAFLADVEAHLPPSMGTRYRDADPVTWCHETTHGVHADLRIKYGRPAFYPGGSRCALVEAPAVTLGEVAAVVPQAYRGSRFNLYLVAQRREWDREPLYVWDEWVAYNNGTTTAIEQGSRRGGGASDDAVACIEFSGYALAVAAAARRKGAPVGEQFRAFLAWELRRSLGLYVKALKIPAYAWPDRRLERLWREGDAFVAGELKALYGDALTVRDLLP
jgi:hypothetical protein